MLKEYMKFITVHHPSTIILEEESKNTIENALHCKHIIKIRGINEIFLVTSDFHMPRLVLFKTFIYNIITLTLYFIVLTLYCTDLCVYLSMY
jgi:hypothetical protein